MGKVQLFVKALLLLLLCFTVLIFFFTVFYPAKKLADFTRPELPENLDDFLKSQETLASPKPGTEKSILWHYQDHRITEYSVIYLHGFSATRKEISPVSEEVAQKLQANLFFTRLKGHGQDSDSMGQATAMDWIRDANEALAIGRRIGKKIILISTSTGSSLAVHLIQNNPEDVKAVIMLSPNFRPYSAFSWLTSGPLGPLVGRIVIGPYLTWQPLNERQAYFWTYKYPYQAVTQLMELLKYVHTIPLEKIQTPLLAFYTDADRVISTTMIKKHFPRFSSGHNQLIHFPTPYHVMAGDILAPEWNQKTIDAIMDYLNHLPALKN